MFFISENPQWEMSVPILFSDELHLWQVFAVFQVNKILREAYILTLNLDFWKSECPFKHVSEDMKTGDKWLLNWNLIDKLVLVGNRSREYTMYIGIKYERFI